MLQKRREIQMHNKILMTTKAREKPDENFYTRTGFSSSPLLPRNKAMKRR